MKSPILLLIALGAGFGIGWIAKPTASTNPEPVATSRPNPPPRSQPGPRPTPDFDRPEPTDSTPPPPPRSYSPINPKDLREAAQELDKAKLLRLTELLSLTPAQQARLQALIAESLTVSQSEDFIGGLTERGNFLLKSMQELFDPEQNAAFLELAQRSQENTIEAATQRELASLIEQIDLTPAQREQAADQIRQLIRQDFTQFPTELSILSDTSPLPLGGTQLPVESILAQQGTPDGLPGDLAGPRVVPEDLKAILTPAQLAKFEAIENRKQRLLNQARGLHR